jgi:hypothetical protein
VDSAIGLELKGKSGSSYRLDRFLGGGQTASVYRATVGASDKNPERRGVAVAVKMMLPGLDTETQRRFWQEETVLVRLWSGLEKSPATQPLLPEVWDSGDSIGGGFLVMTLAQGRPLDELLREGILWDELDALRLIHQLSQIFRSLHSNLQRSYLDFQPRNIFWDGPSRSICVIDWNLLSRSYQSSDGTTAESLAAEGRRAYRQDMQTVAKLFYRLLLGQEVGGLSLLDLAAPARWKELTQSMRRLLWDLLQPSSEYLESATAFHDSMEAEVNRRALSGDGLLKQAAEIVEKIKGLDAAATRRGDGIGLRQEAAALLELAEGKGLSPTWARILQNLSEALHASAETASYVTSGQAFLRAGDRGLAQQFFADGIRLAASPEEQMQGWRWWQLAGASPAAQGYARIEAILRATPTTIADDAVAAEVTSLLNETSGQAGSVLKEIAAQYRIARLLGVETVRLDSAALEEWVKAGETAVSDLDGLSGELEGIGYSQSAWRVQRQGKEFVQAKLVELRGRRQFLDRLQEGLAAIKSVQDALLLLEEHSEFRAEESLSIEFIQKIPNWLDEKESLPRITQLLRELELQKQPAERREAIDRLRSKVHRLQVAQQWIERLLALVDRAHSDPLKISRKNGSQQAIGEILEAVVATVEPSQSQLADVSGENITAESMQSEEESPPVESNQPVTRDEDDIPPPPLVLTSATLMAALDQTTSFLKMAHEEVPKAPKLLEAMAEQLVEASVRLRCSTPQMDEWLAKTFKNKHERLISAPKLTEEIASLRDQLTTDEVGFERTRSKYQQQFRLEIANLKAAVSQQQKTHDEEVKILTEKKAKEEASLTAEIEKLKNSKQAEIERLEARRREFQQKLGTIEEEYTKERATQEERVAGYRHRANEAWADLTSKKQELVQTQEQLQGFRNEAFQARQDVTRAHAELIQIQNDVEFQQTNLTSNKKKLDKNAEDTRQQEAYLAEGERQLQRLEKAISDLHIQQKTEEAELARLRKEQIEIQKQLKQRKLESNDLLLAPRPRNVQNYQSQSHPTYKPLSQDILSNILAQAGSIYRQFEEATSPGNRDLDRAFILSGQMYLCWEQASQIYDGSNEHAKKMEELKMQYNKCKENFLSHVSQSR